MTTRLAALVLVLAACNAPLLLAEGAGGDESTGFFSQPDAPFTPVEASPDATEEWFWVEPHGEGGLIVEGDARDTIRSDAETDADADADATSDVDADADATP